MKVNDGSLMINNVKNDGNTMYNGTLQSSGALIMNGAGNDIKLGSASTIKGSSVTINTYDPSAVDNKDDSKGTLKSNGTIIATGKKGIAINAGDDVEVLGSLQAQNGSVNITSDNGDVNVLYGKLGNGYINSSKDVTINAEKGKIYSDIDMKANNITMTSQGEAVFDVSNIGKHDKDGNKQDDSQHDSQRKQTFNEFLTDHKQGNANSNIIKFMGVDSNGNIINDNPNSLIAIDAWDKDNHQFNIGKQYGGDAENNLNTLNRIGVDKPYYIWLSEANQSGAIKGDDLLNQNFAFKNNIDASQLKLPDGVTGYSPIGADNKEDGFTGTINGRGNSIIGSLEGITPQPLIYKIGKGGTVKNLNFVSASRNEDKGGFNNAIIANKNEGTISNVTTFGNNVVGNGKNVGGIVSENSGTIENSKSLNVITNSADDKNTDGIFVGGIAGVNTGKGTITGSEANSAVTSDNSLGDKSAIGGIVGKNEGTIKDAVSKGVTTGLYDTKNNTFKTADNVGGIAGINSNSITGAYNESITSGLKNVGGIVGKNDKGGNVDNLANVGIVYGGNNVGGVAGQNSGTMTSGRNNAKIIGDKITSDVQGNGGFGENIGGLVGVSEKGSTMNNLTNDESTSVTGVTNVGGLIGKNKGDFKDGQNLMSNSIISGVQNVGGSIGENAGTVSNLNTANKPIIQANEKYKDDPTSKYQNFGGTIGQNSGTAENMSNSADVDLSNADQLQGGVENLGGIIGSNTGNVSGVLLNSGNVTGKNSVGGIIGSNEGKIQGAHLANGAVAHKNADGTIDWSKYDLTTKENTVKGNENVGGVIGTNKGNISKSDVVNTVNGKVSGNQNVGGLIGTNSAGVSGGRDENGNYYKYHVINNGTVEGTGNNSENIGGLIGVNDKNGHLTAAYNTGSVSGTTNVGGVVGKNSGVVDQVFSNTSSISGNNNAGAVIGQNDGSLSDSYGIGTGFDVTGNGSTGTDNNTFSATDEKDAIQKAKEANIKEGNAWKTQNGAEPMLKVFLTKLVYHQKDGATADIPISGQENNGLTVKINEGKNIVEVYKYGEMIGYLAAADGSGAHNIKDYFDTAASDDSDLISINKQNKTGTYEIFFSHQANKQDKDHNNLGYEFVQGAPWNPNDPNDPKNPNGNNFNPNELHPGKDVPKHEITDNPNQPDNPNDKPDQPDNPGKPDNPQPDPNPEPEPEPVAPGVQDRHWQYLHKDAPWDKDKIDNIRERKAEITFQDGGIKVDDSDTLKIDDADSKNE